MRIVMLTPFYQPGVGGSSRLLGEIVDYMVAKGHHVDVITISYGDPQDCIAFDTAQAYRIYRVFAKPIPGATTMALLFQLLALCRRSHYDWIFAATAGVCTFLSSMVSRLTRTPYITYAFGEDVTGFARSNFRAGFLRSALKTAHCVIAISKFTREKVLEIGVSPEKVHLVPPGIDPEPYLRTTDEAVVALRHKYALENKRIILTLARMEPRKGHDTIIKSLPFLLADIPNLHYLVVGKGDATKLHALIRSLNVEQNVTILDYVTDDDLPTLFHVCDVYAMVSRWDKEKQEVEGFGIVYLEAAICGKPSVAGNAGGSTDAVVDGVTGFSVDPESVETVSAVLHRLLTDSALAHQMGEAGKQRVLTDFNRATMLQRFERFFDSSEKDTDREPGDVSGESAGTANEEPKRVNEHDAEGDLKNSVVSADQPTLSYSMQK